MTQKNISNRKEIFYSSFLFLFIFIILISSTSAIPPTERTGDIEIQFAKFDSIQQSKPQTFHFHISNKSQLLNSSQATCDFDLFYQDGSRLYDKTGLGFNPPNDFQVVLNESNFTNLGTYSAITECNTSLQAGAVSFSFEVTPSGFTDNLGFFIVLISIVYLIGFIGFFGRNEWVSAIGGLGMMALSVYLISQGIVIYRDWFTNAIAYITLGLGAMFTLIPVIESIGGRNE